MSLNIRLRKHEKKVKWSLSVKACSVGVRGYEDWGWSRSVGQIDKVLYTRPSEEFIRRFQALSELKDLYHCPLSFIF